MEERLILAAAQMGPASSTKEDNVQRALSLLKQAQEKGARIVGLPELCLTEFFPVKNLREFEIFFNQIPDPITLPIVQFSEKTDMAVVLPFAEREGFSFYNTAVILQRGQVIGKYRKVHLPASLPRGAKGVTVYEKVYFAPGNLGFPVFNLGFARVGIQICYDRHFPEGFRCLALDGAQIIFNPNNAPAWRGTEAMEMLLRARAIENCTFLVVSNKAGIENDRPYTGRSMIISPMGGEIMAVAETDGDELVTAEIDLLDCVDAQKAIFYSRDRRPDLYKRLIT